PQRERITAGACERADRNLAAALESREKRTLRSDTRARLTMLEMAHHSERVAVVQAGDDGECALPDGREPVWRPEQLRRCIRPAEPTQPCDGEHGRVVLSRRHSIQSRV